ncbi:MAG TPA: hypothetical protein VHT30_00910 [Acidimicrobiales bacterium]|nr:hypothetical protein [Acidimicrobiales bacterium]
MKRAAAVLIVALGWLMVLAQPASAHTVSGVGATNWASNLTSISPKPAGLSVKLVEDGSRLEVSNTGPEITILGYEGEPYLRVGPHGVYENLESPATYLNCSRTGCAIPGGLNLTGPPNWKKISSGHVARYHDHRTHWMGSSPPPNVTRAPNQFHVEASWNVTMMQGSTPIVVKGNYVWIPGTSAIPWILVALVLAAVGAGLGLLGLWGLPLAAAVVVLTVNDVYHSIGIAAFWSGDFTYKLGKFFSGSYYSMVGWALGLIGAWLLLRRRVDGLYAAVFAGGSAALFTGLLDFTVLSRSQAPFTASITVDRITVAVSLGLGLGVAIGALIAIRATRPELEDDYDELAVGDDEADTGDTGPSGEDEAAAPGSNGSTPAPVSSIGVEHDN